MKTIRYLVFLAAACQMVSLTAGAQTCNVYHESIADGRVSGPYTVTSTSGAAPYFDGQTGHSYSVEVVESNNAGSGLTVHFGGAQISCPTADGAGFVHTETTSPSGTCCADLKRVGLIATANGFYVTSVSTAGTNTFSYSVSETTLYNPRWSTFSGFATQWGFQNTTNVSISGTLTVSDSVSGGPYTKAVTIPAGTTVFVTTGDIFVGGPIPANHAGGALFAHTGPPASIKADAYFINPSATVIVPAEFKAVRENSH